MYMSGIKSHFDYYVGTIFFCEMYNQSIESAAVALVNGAKVRN